MHVREAEAGVELHVLRELVSDARRGTERAEGVLIGNAVEEDLCRDGGYASLNGIGIKGGRQRDRGRQAISQRWGHLHRQTPAFGRRARRCTVPQPAHLASQRADSRASIGTTGLRAGSPVYWNVSGERASHLHR